MCRIVNPFVADSNCKHAGEPEIGALGRLLHIEAYIIAILRVQGQTVNRSEQNLKTKP